MNVKRLNLNIQELAPTLNILGRQERDGDVIWKEADLMIRKEGGQRKGPL